jgi:ubiquinone/menaquinone biosynthesis C-methylase UbiE
MKDKQYGYAMANAYDMLNDGIDHNAWADFIEEAVKRYSDIPVKDICETACGTGTMACELAKRGYNITASDISEDMLTAAEMKAREMALPVMFVLQDMRYTKMYSQKDLVLCLLDSMNYLTKRDDIVSALESAYKSLKDGGLFIFDMNSKFKFENIYSDNSYILESDGIYCGWENYYNPKTKICDFYLSIFSQDKDGKYIRSDEFQRERMYTVRQMTSMIQNTGFKLCGIFGGFDFSDGDENTCDRLYYILKK